MGELKAYGRAFLLGGIIPIVFHVFGGHNMPWWPDTVSLGIGFGVAAVLLVKKARMDREFKRHARETLDEARRHLPH